MLNTITCAAIKGRLAIIPIAPENCDLVALGPHLLELAACISLLSFARSCIAALLNVCMAADGDALLNNFLAAVPNHTKTASPDSA